MSARIGSTLQLTSELLDWLRSGSGWTAMPWRLRASLAWRARWSSWNFQLGQAQLRDLPPLQAPVFILGPWRSGTTVMHELLTAATGLPTPLTWQCMNACAFMLMGKPPGAVTIARPMDGLEIGALSPQEDEFALLTLGVDSAYRAFLMPERLQELLPTLSQDYWLSTAHTWMPRWESFLQGVLHSGDRPGARLILKSPNHSFRVQAMLRRFPDARLVWMSRDADAVFHSNRKMWKSMFAQHALAKSMDSSELDAFLGAALQASAETLHQLLDARLPAGQFVVCRQDELLADPQATIGRVLKQLALPACSDPHALASAIARTGRGRIEHYQQSAVPTDAATGIDALTQAQRRAGRG
jgi:hypothetical protein